MPFAAPASRSTRCIGRLCHASLPRSFSRVYPYAVSKTDILQWSETPQNHSNFDLLTQWPPLYRPLLPLQLPRYKHSIRTHHTQVVESYQKEAREEVGMVSRDLENIRVLRASHRSAIGFMPRVRRDAGNFRSWYTRRHRVSIAYGLVFREAHLRRTG